MGERLAAVAAHGGSAWGVGDGDRDPDVAGVRPGQRGRGGDLSGSWSPMDRGRRQPATDRRWLRLCVPVGDDERPVDGEDRHHLVRGVDEQHRRGRRLPGVDHPVRFDVPGGADSGGGEAVKASTTTGDRRSSPVNGAATVPPPAGSPAGSPATVPPAGSPAAVRTPLPTRQRRTGYAALGAVLVIGLGAAFGYLYSTAGGQVPVVVVTATVPAGQVITRSDLSTVDVAGDVTAIAGANLESVVGQRAAVGLLPEMVLQRSMVTDVDPTPAGVVQVGVAVKGGQLPADGLVPGDTVQVLRLPAASGGGAAAVPDVVVDRATVFAAVPDPVQAGATLLTLLVPAGQAAAVAGASGAGAAALVKVPAA